MYRLYNYGNKCKVFHNLVLIVNIFQTREINNISRKWCSIILDRVTGVSCLWCVGLLLYTTSRLTINFELLKIYISLLAHLLH